MSLVTPAQAAKLAQQGIYGPILMCDNCGNAITTPYHWKACGIKGDFCSEKCRDAKAGTVPRQRKARDPEKEKEKKEARIKKGIATDEDRYVLPDKLFNGASAADYEKYVLEVMQTEDKEFNMSSFVKGVYRTKPRDFKHTVRKVVRKLLADGVLVIDARKLRLKGKRAKSSKDSKPAAESRLGPANSKPKPQAEPSKGDWRERAKARIKKLKKRK